MQSNIVNNTIQKSNFNEKFVPITVDILVIIDVLLSSYLFFFNINRTTASGVWTVLAIQFFFFPLFIILALIGNKKQYSNTIKILGNPIMGSFKQPLALASHANGVDSGIYTNPKENYMNGLRRAIFLLIGIDIVIMLNFLILSVLVDSIRGADGDFVLYFSLLNQVYYIPLIMLMILIHIKLQGAAAIDEEITKWQPEIITNRKSFRFKLKSSKSLKFLLITSIIFFLLTFSMLVSANQNEDNQNTIINLNEESEFRDVQVYGMIKNSQNIEIIARGNTENQFGQLFPHLLKFTYDTESGKVTDSSILTDFVRGQEILIDTAMTETEIYTFTFNRLEFTYTLYKYDISTGINEVYYVWDLGITWIQEFISQYSFFTYILSPFDGGVHIIQTEFPNPFAGVLTSSTTVRTITDSEVIDTYIDLIVIDAITFGNKTHFLHFSNSFDNFDLTTYNSVGTKFWENGNSHSTLETINSENIIGRRSPNSASLFAVNEAIFYRSTENFYDITNGIDSNLNTDFNTNDFTLRYHGLRGVTNTNDVLYLNSQTVIDYLKIDELNKIITAKADNAKYSASPVANMIVNENSIFSAARGGKIFIWDLDPNAIEEDNSNFWKMIRDAVIIYIFSATAYFLFRRKLD